MPKKKVYIDLGHGGSDCGAIGVNKTEEADVVLSVGKKLKPLLLKQGYDVRFSRETDKTLSLSQRSSDANKWGADILISIHCNAFNGKSKGIETYAYKDVNNKLAVAVHGNLLSTGAYTVNRGIKTKNLHMLRETKMIACLVELAFIDCEEDYKILMANHDTYAIGICKGVCQYFGHKYIESTIVTESNNSAKSNTSSKFVVGEYNKPVKITTNELNVRSGRGTSHKKIGTLKKGDVVTVWTIDKASDGSLWGSFRYNPEYIGYIHMGYAEPTKEQPIVVETLKPIAEGEYNSKLKVTADVLNVRAGRGPKFNKIGTIKKGQVIAGWRIEKGTDGNLWVSFRYNTENVGFCSCKYLEPTK